MLGVGLNIASSYIASAAYPTETNARSILLDGTNDRGQQIDGNNLFTEIDTGSWSMQFYVRFNGANANSQYIMWKGNNFVYYLAMDTDAAGDLRFLGRNGGGGTDITISNIWETNFTNNTWYHVVITSDGSASNRVNKCYIDGSEVSQKSGTIVASSVAIEAPTGNAKFLLGTLLNILFYNIQLDTIATWSGVLSAAEVAEISGNNPDLKEDAGDYSSKASLERYYVMEEGSGTTIADTSGNSKGAITLVNGPAFSTEKPY